MTRTKHPSDHCRPPTKYTIPVNAFGRLHVPRTKIASGLAVTAPGTPHSEEHQAESRRPTSGRAMSGFRRRLPGRDPELHREIIDRDSARRPPDPPDLVICARSLGVVKLSATSSRTPPPATWSRSRSGGAAAARNATPVRPTFARTCASPNAVSLVCTAS